MTDTHVTRDRSRHSHAKSSAKQSSSKLSNFNAVLFSFLLGIFTTCLAVFMFSTNDITLKIPGSGKKAQAPLKTPLTLVAEPEAMPETRYDFYTELAKADVDAAADLKSAPATISGYMVQVGTFKRTGDADAMRAKLTLNGYSAKIDPVKQGNDEILHKVLLGTFKNEQTAKATQQKLKMAGFDSVLVMKYAN